MSLNNIQFELWKNCTNGCDFCFNKGLPCSSKEDKIRILKKVRYNKSVDIYALGCVLYELFTFRNYFDDRIRNKIEKINLEFYDKKWQKLIDSMLAIEYHERPSIEEVLSKLD